MNKIFISCNKINKLITHNYRQTNRHNEDISCLNFICCLWKTEIISFSTVAKNISRLSTPQPTQTNFLLLGRQLTNQSSGSMVTDRKGSRASSNNTLSPRNSNYSEPVPSGFRITGDWPNYDQSPPTTPPHNHIPTSRSILW